MADYIWVRNSDGRVMNVATTSSTPPAGTTEYFENHPIFDPLWTNYTWTRTGVDTYTGAPIDPTQSSPQFTVKNTSTDTTPNYLSSKLVAGTGLDLTTISPGGNETLQADIDITEFTEDTSPASGDFLLTYDVSASAHKKVILSNAQTAGVISQQFCAVDTTGGLDVTAGYTDIPLNSEFKKTASFTHSASSAEVVANFTGSVLLSGYVTLKASTSINIDGDTEIRLMRDTGGGYAQVSGTLCRTGYEGSDVNASGTASFSLILDVVSGTKFKLQGRRLTGTETIVTVANGTGLSISTVGTGPTGPIGPTGSGTNLTIKEGNVSVTNTPHSILDFDGTHFDVSDQGSGRALVKHVFGSEYQTAESDAESTTTATTLQTKLTLTTTSLPSGTYRLGYAFEVGNTLNSVLTTVEVDISGTVEAQTTYESDNDKHSLSGFVHRSMSGVKTINIKYMTAATGTATIRRARLELWRVS